MNRSMLTAKEEWQMFGELTGVRADTTFAIANEVAEVASYEACISEGMAQFPNEDFLDNPIYKLEVFAKGLRGENRQGLLAIIEELRDIQDQQARSSEYGLDELRKAQKSMKAIAAELKNKWS